MEISVQEALEIGLVNDQIHTIVISEVPVLVKAMYFVSASRNGKFHIV